MKLESAVVRQIVETYDKLTNVEKSIADFFVENREITDFSSKSIANRLYVSEASLSRFAKKCGYKGFREFIYAYERMLGEERDDICFYAERVIDTYEELIKKTRDLVNDEQMHRVEKMLTECKRIRVYGKGSSGYAAQEFSMRFMRMGMDIEAITDTHIIKMHAVLADEQTIIMAISLSGSTEEILTAIKLAKKNGAKIIMITASRSEELRNMCDEVIQIASIKNLDEGSIISPQLPIQIMIDILFTYFFQTDFGERLNVYNETLAALYGKSQV